ncbi:MAG: RdgB/HAM1 family non-canonical purine NTP pyrophosphatase [Anaerolineae bacterium]
MTTLLVATNNRGKLAELQELLRDLPLTLVTLQDVGIDFTVEETGHTFAANATLKAEAYARAAGLWTLADDSGLEVDALGGSPGVYTARYGAPDAKTDRDRYTLLLWNMGGVAWDRRTARFHAAVALAHPDQPTQTFDGILEGFIAFAPRGSGGFGYDPVFYVPDYSCHLAELPPDVKNAISHRGRAVAAARPALSRIADGG